MQTNESPRSAVPDASDGSHERDNRHRIVVGVGASAGGFEAFQEMLAGLGEDPGIAIVFVQHLDPNSKSLLADLLEQRTTLAIKVVQTRKKLQRNTIYLCPPGGRLQISKGWIVLQDRDSNQKNPIDHLFHSLAEAETERSVGVILSGTGSDGTLGLKSISDAGGMTFAQDSESAKFDAMPRNAAITGVADHVLPPAKIAAELLKYVDYLRLNTQPAASRRREQAIQHAIPGIADILLSSTGHNFKHYKPSTIGRRIGRRMQVLKIATVDEYTDRLTRDADESQNLFRELLIGVTAFFRDPESFEYLSGEVIPKLFENRMPDNPARIWVPGCASGEEAYTIAMLCHEHVDRLPEPKPTFQIFASDIDERALSIARGGVYPSGNAEQLSPERLKRFFLKKGKRYHVRKEIRETVLFSLHNLISDPPFSRQDLISCRNLLIYLGPHLQKKLIPLFHFALRPNGYLFLGPSETISGHGDLFRGVNERHRISQRKGTAIGSAMPLSIATRASGLQRAVEHAPLADDHSDVVQIMQRIVLDEFAPKSVVIDEVGHIICSSADTTKYVSIGDGRFQNNILKMARRGLRIGLRAAFSQAKAKRRRVVHENVSVHTENGKQRVMLTVQPMMQLGEDSGLFLVVFHDVGLPLDLSPDLPEKAVETFARGELDQHADALIDQLERELTSTRDDLEKTMQEMEATNEELKSSNEELLSMNEELQSANEELETSKEEIRAGSEAISRANSDLQNLLRSTQIATIFLDREHCIRSFTPAATEIYSLIITDVGRPLEKFVPSVHGMPPLPDFQSLSDGSIVQHTVNADNDRTYIRRVLPYRSHEGEMDGMVVTFSDVTELKLAQRELIANQQQLDLALEAGRLGTWNWDIQTDAIEWSRHLYEIFGCTDLDFNGTLQSFECLVHPDDREHVQEAIRKTFEAGATEYEAEFRIVRPDNGQSVWTIGKGIVEYAQDGHPLRITGTANDNTNRKRRELNLGFLAELQAKINSLQSVRDILEVACRCTAEHLDLSRCTFSQFVDGTSVAEVVGDYHDGATSRSLVGHYEMDDFYDEVQQAGFAIGRQVIIRNVANDIPDAARRTRLKQLDIVSFCNSPFAADGELRYILTGFHDTPYWWTDEEIRLMDDISQRLGVRVERAKAETELAQAKQKMDLALRVAGVSSWAWDFETDQLIHEPNLNRLWGFDPETFPTLEQFVQQIHPDHRKRVEEAIGVVLKDGGPYDIEYPIELPDGTRRWIRAVGRGTPRDSADPEFVGVVVDTTQRKQNELELTNRELYLRRVIDGSVAFLGVLDTEGALREVNQLALDVIEVTRDEVVGNPFWETNWWTHDPDVQRVVRQAFENALKGQAFRSDLTYRTAEGEVRHVDFQVAPVSDSEGNVTHATVSGLDITDRLVYQRKLKDREYELQLGMEIAEFGLARIDYRSDTLDLSGRSAELCGFGTDRVIVSRAQIHERFHADDRNKVEAAIKACLENEAGGELVQEHRVVMPDGSVRWLDVRKRVFFDHSTDPPTPTHGILAVRNITQQKFVESELREREKQVRRIIDNQLGLVAVLDRQGIVLEVNQVAADAAGVTREQLIGRPFWECYWWAFSDDVVWRVKQAVRRALLGEVVRYDTEIRIANDQRMMIDFMLAPVLDAEGHVTHLIPSGVDIRERHAIEQNLRATTNKLETLFESTFYLTGMMDLEGTLTDVSEKSLSEFGLHRDDVIGRKFWDTAWFEDQPATRRKMIREFQNVLRGKTWRETVLYTHPTLGTRYSDSVFTPGIDDEGDIQFVVCHGSDVTEQHEATNRIKISEERLRQAAVATGFGTFQVDVGKQTVWYSDEFKRMVGLSPSEDLKVSLGSVPTFVHPDDRDDVDAHLKMVLNDLTAADHSHVHRIVKADGEVRYVRMQSRSIFKGTGPSKHVRTIVGTLLDITQQHEFEESLKEARAAAVAANEAKSAFLANMSHEIRTPMTAILGYTDLTLNLIDHQKARDYLRTIHRNGDFLLEIINDILDLSKIEANKLQINRERFAPDRLLEDVRGIMDVRAKESGITLSVQYDNQIPREIAGDPKRLKQILINLVGNAVKFTRAGAVRVNVRYEPIPKERSTSDTPQENVSELTAAGHLRIAITDTGIGISKAHLKKLFQPFTQGDSSVNREFGGTGLGLTISKRLAEMLGGTISVESSEGKGSTFTLTVATGDVEGVEMIEPEVTDVTAVPDVDRKAPNNIQLSGRVLVVDDRRDIRFLSATFLTKAGARVEEAEDGQLGLERVREAIESGGGFDMILLDMQMPNLDGYQTAAALRELGYEGPIIALTADAMQGDMKRCLEAGCNEYLSKPINKAALLTMASRLLAKD